MKKQIVAALCFFLLVCGTSCQNIGFGGIGSTKLSNSTAKGTQGEDPDDLEAVYQKLAGQLWSSLNGLYYFENGKFTEYVYVGEIKADWRERTYIKKEPESFQIEYADEYYKREEGSDGKYTVVPRNEDEHGVAYKLTSESRPDIFWIKSEKQNAEMYCYQYKDGQVYQDYSDVLGYVMVHDEFGNNVKFSEDMLNIIEADDSLGDAGQGAHN